MTTPSALATSDATRDVSSAPRALIAEDEPLLAQALAAELRRAWPDLLLLPTAQDGDEAIALALRHRPELLFLDIRMPGCNGLDAAQAIVEDWPDDTPLPLIVFVTAYDQHALQAFERHAVDYLLKPVQPARLAACCTRLQGLLQRAHAASATQVQPDINGATRGHGVSADASDQATSEHPGADNNAALLNQLRALLSAAPHASSHPTDAPLQVIQAAVGQQVHLIPVDEVLYFEAADKYVRVLTATREHLIRQSLRELLPQLDPQRFWQVHRGTVVNIREVTQALRDESGKVTLTLRQRPERLAVSRLYAGRFKGM